jgi:hypothetical protein
MDLGSQVLNAARQCGRPPRWTSRCGSRSRRRERVELVYPGAVTGSAIWDLAAQDRTMLWTVVGSVAIASSPSRYRTWTTG